MCMTKDWQGNTSSVFKTIGASSHTSEERELNDYYATDPYAIDVLINEGGIQLDKNVWECACGEGHLSKKLESYGYNVKSTDLVNRGYGDSGVDFLSCSDYWDGDILTNPPYKYAKEFVEHALELVPEGKKVIMFLKLTFLEGKARKRMFTQTPPKYLLVSSSRLLCAKNGDFDGLKSGGGSAVAYGWYIFEKGYKGETIIRWVN